MIVCRSRCLSIIGLLFYFETLQRSWRCPNYRTWKTSWRCGDLHAHPELCYEEHRTAQVVAGTLRGWGIEVHTGIAKTGVVGVLRQGTSDRAIMLRADMDALPMQEENQFEHRSRHDGKMHGCGHDGHTAMLLAAARHLQQHGGFDGTVYLCFQPAEEGGAGARAMIQDGLFERFPARPCSACTTGRAWKPARSASAPVP